MGTDQKMRTKQRVQNLQGPTIVGNIQNLLGVQALTFLGRPTKKCGGPDVTGYRCCATRTAGDYGACVRTVRP